MEGEDGRGKWNHLWELRWIEAARVGLLFKIPFGPSADGRSSWERVVAFFRLSPLPHFRVDSPAGSSVFGIRKAGRSDGRTDGANASDEAGKSGNVQPGDEKLQLLP